jgi:hypothetical protein
MYASSGFDVDHSLSRTNRQLEINGKHLKKQLQGSVTSSHSYGVATDDFFQMSNIIVPDHVIASPSFSIRVH